MKISVNSPSYKRADNVKTLKIFPFAKIWVDYKEADEYGRNYPNADIIACPDGVQGNVSRIRNYILDVEFGNGADAVCLIDDDFAGLYSYQLDPEKCEMIEMKMDSDDLLAFIEKYSILANDLGAKFWGVNCVPDRMAYRPYTPFSTTNVFIGGPFQVFMKGNRCRYDEKLPLKEDYDMTLQQMQKERVVLRVNSFHYRCEQSTMVGGCAIMRNREKERQQFELLQKKWGGGDSKKRQIKQE